MIIIIILIIIIFIIFIIEGNGLTPSIDRSIEHRRRHQVRPLYHYHLYYHSYYYYGGQWTDAIDRPID